MDTTAVAVTVVSSLLSGLIATLVSTWCYRRHERAAIKRDVFRRFAGNRHLLTVVPCESTAEPFIALNEAFIVFADSRQVIHALKMMHEELGQPGRLVDNIVTLVKSMARATGIHMRELNDSFIERPFAPGKGIGSEQQAGGDA